MEVKLKKNGWHKKVQIYVLGERNVPTFNNLCPYFWLTNFCLLATIIPIIPTYYAIRWCLRMLVVGIDKLSESMYNSLCKPVVERRAVAMDDDDLLKAWVLKVSQGYWEDYKNPLYKNYQFFRSDYFGDDIVYNIKTKRKDKIREYFDIWKSKNPDWQVKLEKLQEKRIAMYEQVKKDREALWARIQKEQADEEESKRKAKFRREKAMIMIVKYTKYILIPIAAFILYWIGKGIYNLMTWGYNHFDYNKFMMYSYIALGCVVGIVIIYFIIIFLSSVFSKMTVCLGDCWVTRFFKWIGGPLGKLLNLLGVGAISIGNFFGFFWQYLMLAKKDYCPGIEWQEEAEK